MKVAKGRGPDARIMARSAATRRGRPASRARRASCESAMVRARRAALVLDLEDRLDLHGHAVGQLLEAHCRAGVGAHVTPQLAQQLRRAVDYLRRAGEV